MSWYHKNIDGGTDELKRENETGTKEKDKNKENWNKKVLESNSAVKIVILVVYLSGLSLAK